MSGLNANPERKGGDMGAATLETEERRGRIRGGREIERRRKGRRDTHKLVVREEGGWREELTTVTNGILKLGGFVFVPCTWHM